MKVLMLGWEFPPFISGGLGTACYGLTRAMSRIGTEITFVLPRPVSSQYSSHVKMAGPEAGKISGSELFESEEFANISFRTIDSLVKPYQTSEDFNRLLQQMRQNFAEGEAALRELMGMIPSGANYGENLYQEVQRYARMASLISRGEEFDVVHAHDWMTYPAGIAISTMTGKPLVVHIHSTEFDRSGEHVNQMVYDIERQGFHHAQQVIAVSHMTKSVVVNRYGVGNDKVSVVYNAIERNGNFVEVDAARASIRKNEKIVLFLGRITMQKGPEYFLAAARRVLEKVQNVKFVMAGSGDMVRRTIEMAAEMGIGHKVLFTGFLQGQDVDKIFQMADLFVMPSVSEPFGLVPLEALRNDVPVLISRQSGVAEVLSHALKVDFWDIDEMANKIVAVLRHPPLQSTLREHGNFEVRKLNWETSARQCIDIYQSVSGAAVA